MDWNVAGTALALLLTIMIYSYLIGDNPVFRLAEHILVGVSVGWATIQILYNLIIPTVKTVVSGMQEGNLSGPFFAALVPLLLGLVLLTRPLRVSRPVTNLVMAFVVGTVAALSLAGALSGTLLPQIGATMSPLNSGDIFGRVVLLVGTLVSLWYFQFTLTKPAQPQATLTPLAVASDRVRLFGRWTIMVAFGAVFAAVFLTYFAALLDRLLFIINVRF